MTRSLCLLLTSLLVLLSHAQSNAAESKPTVVCFGDSITKSVRQTGDKTYPAQLAKKLGTEVINAGVGGNTTTAGLARMEKDVLNHQPGIVVILFGTNDSAMTGPKKYKASLDAYKANLLKMIERCQKQGAKVVLCTIPPINPEPYFQRHPKEVYDAEGGLEEILNRYRQAVAEISKAQSIPLVDLATKLDKTKALSPDGVHMTDEGSEMIATLVAEVVTKEFPRTSAKPN